MRSSLSSVELADQESNEELSLEDSLIDFSTKLIFTCSFCEKRTVSYEAPLNFTQKISGGGSFCSFCIRNDFYTKKSKNILIASFRGIIGYLYFSLYKIPFQPILYLSEIQDMIDIHKKIGLLNPVFYYDEESYCWFVDFGKVGNEKRKIKANDVKNTFTEILTSFNLYDFVEDIKVHALVKKYHEAVDAFYQSRERPKDKKILSPTLKGCGASSVAKLSSTKADTKKIPVEECRDFMPYHFEKKSKL